MNANAPRGCRPLGVEPIKGRLRARGDERCIPPRRGLGDCATTHGHWRQRRARRVVVQRRVRHPAARALTWCEHAKAALGVMGLSQEDQWQLKDSGVRALLPQRRSTGGHQ